MPYIAQSLASVPQAYHYQQSRQQCEITRNGDVESQPMPHHRQVVAHAGVAYLRGIHQQERHFAQHSH